MISLRGADSPDVNFRFTAVAFHFTWLIIDKCPKRAFDVEEIRLSSPRCCSVGFAFACVAGSRSPGLTITLLNNNPFSDSSGPIGSSLPVVAQVEDSSGNPIDGVTVNFNVTSGPNAGLTDSATSGPSSGPGYLCDTVGRLQGVAEFYYPSTQTGTDVIQASAVVNGTTLTTSTSFDWFNPASTITLTSQSIAPGQTITAIVNGFAGTWGGFPDYHNCAPNEHQTTITLDSLRNSILSRLSVFLRS